MNRKVLTWIITACSLIVAGVHLLRPDLAIDAITITLFLVAVLPWLSPLFKAVELPGGVKVEFAELEKAQREAESAGILAAPTTPHKDEAASRLIPTDDPNLALAGLRIELERRLRKIAERHGVAGNSRGIGPLLRDLQERNLLSSEQSSILADLLPSLNAAVHGASVDPRASAWAVEVGPRLIAGLDLNDSIDMDSLIVSWRSADGASVAEVGEELSKAAIRSPREFLRVMSSSPKDFDHWLQKLQHHTFTLVQSRNDLEDELYEAYYERLRIRLVETMKQFAHDPKYGEIAKRIVESVETVAIRKIL
jgi:hypothetical protein